MNGTDRSSAELAQDIVREAQDLVRLELELAKQELRELAIRNAWAVGLFAFAALLLMLTVLVAVPVLLVLLWDRHVLGAGIWIAVYVIGGAVLAFAGWRTLRLEPPRRTLASLEETRQWVLRQIRSNDR